MSLTASSTLCVARGVRGGGRGGHRSDWHRSRPRPDRRSPASPTRWRRSPRGGRAHGHPSATSNTRPTMPAAQPAQQAATPIAPCQKPGRSRYQSSTAITSSSSTSRSNATDRVSVAAKAGDCHVAERAHAVRGRVDEDQRVGVSVLGTVMRACVAMVAPLHQCLAPLSRSAVQGRRVGPTPPPTPRRWLRSPGGRLGEDRLPVVVGFSEATERRGLWRRSARAQEALRRPPVTGCRQAVGQAVDFRRGQVDHGRVQRSIVNDFVWDRVPGHRPRRRPQSLGPSTERSTSWTSWPRCR